jgi:hypothetical protein
MRMDFTFDVMVDEYPTAQIEYAAEFSHDDDDASDWQISRLLMEAVWWEDGPNGGVRTSKEVEVKEDHYLYSRLLLDVLQSRHEIDAEWQNWLLGNAPEIASASARERVFDTSLETAGRV